MKSIFCVCAIALIVIVCLLKGVNGMLATSSLAVLAGIAGYTASEVKHRKS